MGQGRNKKKKSWVKDENTAYQNLWDAVKAVLRKFVVIKSTLRKKNDLSPKKIYRWPADTWKNAQHP